MWQPLKIVRFFLTSIYRTYGTIKLLCRAAINQKFLAWLSVNQDKTNHGKCHHSHKKREDSLEIRVVYIEICVVT